MKSLAMYHQRQLARYDAYAAMMRWYDTTLNQYCVEIIHDVTDEDTVGTQTWAGAKDYALRMFERWAAEFVALC